VSENALPQPVKPAWIAGATQPPPFANQDVHIWRFRAEWHPAVELRSALDEAERERTLRITSEVARRHFAASQAALRHVLSRYIAVAPNQIAFKRGEHGKPFLADVYRSELQFNLSHSHEWGVVAVAPQREVGIDLERVRERTAAPRLVDRFYSEHERAAFTSAPPSDQLRIFFRLWTRKEGYIKATGSGLSVSLRAIDTLGPQQDSTWYQEFSVDDDYVACLVSAGLPPRLSYFDLTFP
jgi:4'-phosphopantetheinyl transferase